MRGFSELVPLNEVINEVGFFKDLNDIEERNKLQKKLERSVSISLVGDELVYINFKWNKREQMKEILSILVEKFIEKLLAPTKSSLDSSEIFFKNQLIEIRKDLEGAEDKLAKFKRENREALPELLNINQGALATLEQKKQGKLVELSGAKAGLETLKVQLSKTNPVMGKIEEQIIKLESDIEILRVKYTDNHSILQIKLSKLKKIIERKNELKKENKKMNIDSLWQIANTLPFGTNKKEGALLLSQLINLESSTNNLVQLENEIKMLTKQISVVTERLLSSSEIDKSLRQLQRDYKVKQNLYSKMLERYEMSKVTGKLVKYEGPDKVKTIERAYSPTIPINNSIIINSIIGVFLGLLTSITITFVLTGNIEDLTAFFYQSTVLIVCFGGMDAVWIPDFIHLRLLYYNE